VDNEMLSERVTKLHESEELVWTSRVRQHRSKRCLFFHLSIFGVEGVGSRLDGERRARSILVRRKGGACGWSKLDPNCWTFNYMYCTSALSLLE
jgi:hypothetical protein